MKHRWIYAIFLLTTVVGLVVSLRGRTGNITPQELLSPKWTNDGPFELSVERGRFALAYSIAEERSLFYSLPVAHFATPDLGYKDGRYVSLFAPGLSFLILPGYFIGKTVGLAQVGAYGTIALFSLTNVILIAAIAIRLGAHPAPAAFSALAFLFATPAFAYAVSLYQHHASTFLILSTLFILLRFPRSKVMGAVSWFLVGSALLVDYPNLFLLAPVALAGLRRAWGNVKDRLGYTLLLKPLWFLPLVGAIVPLLLFFWFNDESYGNPFQLSGAVAQVRAIDEQGKPTAPRGFDPEDVKQFVNPDQKVDRSPLRFFKPRNIVEGLFIHLVSPDRGVVVYAPIVFLGVIGLAFLYQRRPSWAAILFGTVAVNLALYSMWGDPWGGWAFGSRYLIPSYAILTLSMSFFLTWTKRRTLAMGSALLLFIYGTAVNTAGALTTNANPPKVEVLALEKLSGKEEKFTVERNLDVLRANRSKSLLFQTVGNRYTDAWTLYISTVSFLVVGATLVSASFIVRRETSTS